MLVEFVSLAVNAHTQVGYVNNFQHPTLKQGSEKGRVQVLDLTGKGATQFILVDNLLLMSASNPDYPASKGFGSTFRLRYPVVSY